VPEISQNVENKRSKNFDKRPNHRQKILAGEVNIRRDCDRKRVRCRLLCGHGRVPRPAFVIDCFVMILTPAMRCSLLWKFFTESPDTLIIVARTLNTAFVPIPGHLRANRAYLSKDTDSPRVY